MKIAYVTAATIPSLAANGVQTTKMCEAFVRAGHRVLLVSSDKDESAPDVDPFEFYGLASRFSHLRVSWPRRLPSPGSIYATRVIARLRRVRPDLVYTRSLRVAVAAAALSLPTILELHSLGVVSRSYAPLAFRTLLRLPALRQVVTISEALRRDVESAFPPSIGHCIVAHDAATLPRRDLVPTELERHEGEVLVGYVGGLYPGRGLGLVRSLAERLPSFRFHLAGGGELADGFTSNGSSWPTNVAFHGFISPREADGFRAACDILVAPYQTRVATFGGEGDTSRWMSPLKIFEYMAAGRPIVCSDLPVLREVLDDGETAILCPPADVDAWCSALAKLAANRDLGQRLAAAARQQFLERYTYDQRARNVLSALTNP